MSRRAPGRATRQILSGSQLNPTSNAVGGQKNVGEPVAVAFWYLVALAVLVVVTSIVWSIWGMGVASPFLLILSIGYVASWIIL